MCENRLAKQVIRNRQRRNDKKQATALRRKAKAARRWNRKANGKQRKPERKYPLMMFSSITMLYDPYRAKSTYNCDVTESTRYDWKIFQ